MSLSSRCRNLKKKLLKETLLIQPLPTYFQIITRLLKLSIKILSTRPSVVLSNLCCAYKTTHGNTTNTTNITSTLSCQTFTRLIEPLSKSCQTIVRFVKLPMETLLREPLPKSSQTITRLTKLPCTNTSLYESLIMCECVSPETFENINLDFYKTLVKDRLC